jgi:hypothetical protein
VQVEPPPATPPPPPERPSVRILRLAPKTSPPCRPTV